MSTERAQRLQQTLDARRRPERDLAIATVVGAFAQHARRVNDRLGDLVQLWEQLIPADLAARTRLVGLRASVLQVEADSAATLYDVDRLLRQGLEATLRQKYRGTLTRIRLKVGAMDDQPARRPAAARAGRKTSRRA
jgi:hypothetical protein